MNCSKPYILYSFLLSPFCQLTGWNFYSTTYLQTFAIQNVEGRDFDMDTATVITFYYLTGRCSLRR